MSLTPDEIAKVADLARLTITDAERDRLQQQLADILKYVHRLDGVDTSDVVPLVHAVEVSNVLRPDVPQESLPREQALANAPQTDGLYFLVPPILEER
ncbi:MAG: Asp-tRNA(Asn)/Glu-tRNA(Gln) amidotransferase subunit GatC [Planctomycetaceae bacterium]|nr:Asp-tRNA(Asn)/Glu-tRNA(Gln) amidotransferase subunit GatC [Planctomycetaceae bacterium]